MSLDHPERCAAGRLASDIAEAHGVTVHAMLRGSEPEALAARRRLCEALLGQGWTPTEIETNFGLPPGAARPQDAPERTRRPSGTYEAPKRVPGANGAEELPAKVAVVARAPSLAAVIRLATGVETPRIQRVYSNGVARPASDGCQAPRGASATKRCGKVVVDSGLRLCRWHAGRRGGD